MKPSELTSPYADLAQQLYIADETTRSINGNSYEGMQATALQAIAQQLSVANAIALRKLEEA